MINSIIGIQSFKGSFRRNCYLQPINGEDEIALEQSCGGYIDPVSFNVTGYINRFNETSASTKGFVCPLGQICKVNIHVQAVSVCAEVLQEGPDNPQSGIEGFDTIYYSALQVFIVSSANGVSTRHLLRIVILIKKFAVVSSNVLHDGR